jgi:CTP synthase
VVGKYTAMKDAYKSLTEALHHGGLANNVKVNINWVDARAFDASDEELTAELEDVDAILVPGAFGDSGAEGKIKAVRFARERKIPYFGICFGMQMACVEAARHQAGLPEASSTEFGDTPHPVVGLMTEWVQGNQRQVRDEGTDLGGTMRLGAYTAVLKADSVVSRAYHGATSITERHRHRYEVNMAYRDVLEANGLIFSGVSPDGILPEIVERPDHPWFVGVQYHPELKSRPFEPHPLFADFVRAALVQSRLV